MGNPIFNEEYDRNQCFFPPTTPLGNDSMSLKHYFNPYKGDDEVFHQQLDMSTMMSLVSMNVQCQPPVSELDPVVRKIASIYIVLS